MGNARSSLAGKASRRGKKVVLPERRSIPGVGINGRRLTEAALFAQNQELLRMQVQLEEACNRHAALYDFAPVGCVTFDSGGLITQCNLTFSRLLNRRVRGLKGTPFGALVVPGDISKFLAHLRDCKKRNAVTTTDLNLRTPAGCLPIQLVSARDPALGGHILTVINDMRTIRAAEAWAAEAHQLLVSRVKERTASLVSMNRALEQEILERHRLEREILQVTDREQRRLGEELHDDHCQRLTALAFMASAMASRIKKQVPDEAKDLKKIASHLNESARNARDIARGLHPVQLDSAGLASALEELSQSVDSGITCRLLVKREILVPDRTAALYLYRIAQEAVTNALKHSNCKSIEIHLNRNNEETILSISDDGCGLAKAPPKSSGMGFHLMEYRARSIGASLAIECVRPRGTRVSCFLPHK
jgi:signal transduction histidine kinase